MLRTMRLAAALAALFVAAPAAALPIDYDPAFGTAGVATLPYTSAGVGVLLPGGSIAVAVGRIDVSHVVRLTPAGALDPDFSPIVGMPEETPYFRGSFTGLAALPDGRIAVLQSQSGVPGLCRGWFGRHLPNGWGDPTLATNIVGPCGNGLAATAQGEFYSGFHRNVGISFPTSTAVLRVAATGTLIEFLAQMTAAPGEMLPWTYGKVVLTPDLRPIALARPEVPGLGAVRLLGGAPDPAFGARGLASVQTVERVVGHDIAIAQDGSIVVAGLPTSSPAPGFYVAKFRPDGSPDAGFGSGGLARLVIARGDERVDSVVLAIQPDGRVLLAGNVRSSAALQPFYSVALARLTTGGAPDPHFAPGGVATLSLDRGTHLGFLAVRPEGSILLGVSYWPLAPGNAETRAAVVQLQGGNDPVARPWRERFAVEYFHAGYGHYFVSADGEEITRLDATPASGWARTGQGFRVWDDADASLAPVCRFWSDQTWAPKSSHFYTHDPDECAKVKADPAWIFERNAFMVRRPQGPSGARTCPPGSQPLYRAYNRGMSGASNHRYTVDAAILDAMLAQGWVAEGDATTRVFACVPAP